MIYFCHAFWIKNFILLRSIKFFYKIFDIKVNLSIVFYLETNKQSKIANQKIEKHFHVFVNY